MIEVKGYSTISGDNIHETINILDIESFLEELDIHGFNKCNQIVYQTILINNKYIYIKELKLALK